MRIVLVEDNEILANGIKDALEDKAHCVEHFTDGREGVEHLLSEGADIAILDVNLPSMSGFEIVRRVRSNKLHMPLLMLTARGDTDDRVRGLDAGADDYLVKPFEMEELEARLRALTRRQYQVRETAEQCGFLTFDRNSRQIVGTDGPLSLSKRELALFECLFDRQGQIVSPTIIADQVYGIGSDTDPNAVQLLVSRLRKRLTSQGVVIHTARGLGYMLDSETTAS